MGEQTLTLRDPEKKIVSDALNAYSQSCFDKAEHYRELNIAGGGILGDVALYYMQRGQSTIRILNRIESVHGAKPCGVEAKTEPLATEG